MKYQLVDSKGNPVLRDKKPVIVDVRNETQAAAFEKQGFAPIEEEK